ncbi:histone deacetylase family protein [Algisphaera agarilytica]|uniref:Acetoin utilization deacetylase AcuC-like enzyme n=1 Tax=Algisphaera agarilytica TaxID=1385975 RepID=A0A7X0LJ95_9BACT|nr:histone deacetylase [Algisphaera agarilytica]MBB6428612.1 acetoin utilization deacetylase AcuC-like enzyme [Algisphaera agarilytica]
MTTGLIYDDRFLEHDTGPGHPERPDRLRAIVSALQASGLWAQLNHLAFEPATATQLQRLHPQDYIDRVHDACVAGLPYIDVPDSAISEGSAEIAVLAAGGVLRATEAVMWGEVDNAFCAIRPPGHHAERDRSMGFCLFGNVALAAESLITDHGLERVAIVDFDVHHGNGTQHLLEHRGDILFVSVHEHPDHQYPGTGYEHETGIGDGEGATLNVPLPPGSDDTAYRAAFDQTILPKIDAFAPQFVLFSAGFDAGTADPLGGMRLSTDGFIEITRKVRGLADRHAQGRIVSVLEGGYDLDALATGVCGHVSVLMESGLGGTDILGG